MKRLRWVFLTLYAVAWPFVCMAELFLPAMVDPVLTSQTEVRMRKIGALVTLAIALAALAFSQTDTFAHEPDEIEIVVCEVHEVGPDVVYRWIDR